jgi:hypothetical protein
MHSSRRDFSLAHLLLAVELSLVLFFCMRPAVDPDYGWHIANGLHVLDGKIFSGHDIYSWTATNIWIAHEWLTEAFMSTIHRTMGPSANSVIAALIGVATYAVVVSRLRKRQFGWTTVLIALPIIFIGAMRSLGVRPLMLELLYVSLLVAGIDVFLEGKVSRRSAGFLTLVFGVVWVNTHGSFILLPVVLWITAAELLLSRDKRWLDLALAGAIAAVAALLNPWGFRIFGFATQSISSQPTLAFIDEWKRPVLTESLAIPLLLQTLLALIGIALTWRSKKTLAGILRTLAFGYLAFSSGRHIMIFGIAAAELIALGIQGALPRSQKALATSETNSDPRRSVVNIAAAAAIAAMIARAGWVQVSPAAQTKATAAHYPVGIPVRSNLDSSDKLLNEYRWGGFLIMNNVLPVFIDGRSELYGDDQLRRYATMIHLERGWQETITSLGITKVLMPRDSRLATALTQAGWTPVAADSVGVLLKKP